MTEDYIPTTMPSKKEHKTIRKVYLPIEVRNLILKHYEMFSRMGLTYSEKALLSNFCNGIIYDLKKEE